MASGRQSSNSVPAKARPPSKQQAAGSQRMLCYFIVILLVSVVVLFATGTAAALIIKHYWPAVYPGAQDNELIFSLSSPHTEKTMEPATPTPTPFTSVPETRKTVGPAMTTQTPFTSVPETRKTVGPAMTTQTPFTSVPETRKTLGPAIPTKTPFIPAPELFRLPSSLFPSAYHLNLTVFLPGYGARISAEKEFTYEGKVTVTITARLKTNVIVLNSLNLTFDGKEAITVISKNINKPLKAIDFSTNNDLEILNITLSRELYVNESVVATILFDGEIIDKLKGFYKTKHREGGKKIVSASTHFEPFYARRFVPCFDEPAFKAKWTVVVKHPMGTIALSNGLEHPQLSADGDFLTTIFDETPIMSSYILALFVGNYAYQEDETERGTRIRAYARTAEANKTFYAVSAAKKVLSAYEKFYGIDYPLQKLDMIGIPDFDPGAMENWGLVMYLEEYLLPPSSSEEVVAIYVAHELAHQWFGNLVTMEWWEDLWLNEGFATLFEFYGADIVDKEFHINNRFVENAQSAQKFDALSTSHPLSPKITKASEIEDVFDTISYEKGAAVLAMIRRVMGEAAFQKGVLAYLNKHRYGNVRSADLWEALSDAAKGAGVKGPGGQPLDITKFGKQWTEQMGFPLLSFARLNDSHVRITQSRFKVDKEKPDRAAFQDPEFGFKWDVPVFLLSGKQQMPVLWLPGDKQTNVFDGHLDVAIPSDEKSALKLDISTEFYRADYGEEGWLAIGAELSEKEPNATDDKQHAHTFFSPLVRARLAYDAFAIAEVGLLNYTTLLESFSFIKNERADLPLLAFRTGIYDILQRFGVQQGVVAFKKYIRCIFAGPFETTETPVKENVGIIKRSTVRNSEKHIREMKHPYVPSFRTLACEVEYDGCIRERLDDFDNQFVNTCHKTVNASENCNKIDPSLRRRTYCTAVRFGPADVYTIVFDHAIAANDEKERARFVSGLTCTVDIAHLKELLLSSLQTENGTNADLIRLQDVGLLFTQVSNNQAAALLLPEFFYSHWNIIKEKLKNVPSQLKSVILASFSHLSTDSDINKLNSWLRDHPDAASLYGFRKVLDTAASNRDWRVKHLEPLVAFFMEKKICTN